MNTKIWTASVKGKPKGKKVSTVVFDDLKNAFIPKIKVVKKVKCLDGSFDSTEFAVAHQEHYTQFPIQVMEFCHVNGLSWCAANVVKYVCREGKKDGVKDLYKAMDYLKCLIHFKETGVFLPPNKLAEVKK